MPPPCKLHSIVFIRKFCFPHMQVRGFRRIFAHTAGIFFQRGIARPETGEISSLSCEECPEEHIVVTLFEIESTPESRKVVHGLRQFLQCFMACCLHCMRVSVDNAGLCGTGA